MESISAHSEWLTFKESVLSDAPEMQISEMQKAFYAGIISAMNIMVAIPDDYTEDQRALVMHNIVGEASDILTEKR